MKVYGVGNVKFHDLPRNYGSEKQNTQKKCSLYKILVMQNSSFCFIIMVAPF